MEAVMSLATNPHVWIVFLTGLIIGILVGQRRF